MNKKHLTGTITLKTCRECAECCRHFAFAKLSQLEIEKIEDFTGLHFSKFTYLIGTNGEGRFLKFKENGDCIFLKRDEDTYSCLIYDARSKICREYPSNPKQNETCYINRVRGQVAFDSYEISKDLKIPEDLSALPAQLTKSTVEVTLNAELETSLEDSLPLRQI